MSVGSEVAYRRSGEQTMTLEVGGDLVSFKASREDGVGSLFLELVSPPGGGPHRTRTPPRSCCTSSRASSSSYVEQVRRR